MPIKVESKGNNSIRREFTKRKLQTVLIKETTVPLTVFLTDLLSFNHPELPYHLALAAGLVKHMFLQMSQVPAGRG